MQQHHERHLEQKRNPVRNAYGGYNRSPFEVSSDLFHAATNALKDNHPRARDRVAAEETASSNAFHARPWVRAGVGATQLSEKERQEQLQEAKRIYDDSVTVESAKITSTSNTLAAVPDTRPLCNQRMDGQVNGVGHVPLDGPSDVDDSLETAEAIPSAGDSAECRPASFVAVPPTRSVSSSSVHQEKRYVHRTVTEQRLLPKLLPSALKRPRQETVSAAHEQLEDDKLTVKQSAAASEVSQSPAVFSKRQVMENKRLEALFGGQKKRR
jgi:hypothetical protein